MILVVFLINGFDFVTIESGQRLVTPHRFGFVSLGRFIVGIFSIFLRRDI
jgi:hypothetical protein